MPLHFWLPRAMAAPTPVSAYLHSAAMVAAGVLVLGRVHPLLALDQTVLDGLLVVGLASIVVGGVLALAQDELKQILAHSTISQYGYVVALYGIGGAAGAGAAALYVLTHAIAKSALFMTAGAVTEATGESRLSHLGGLARPMPVLAAASGVAAATLAALPLTLGLLQGRAVLRRGPRARDVRGGHGRRRRRAHVRLHRAVLARALHGRAPGRAARRSRRCSSRRSCVLAAVALAGGFVVGPFAGLAGDAAAVTHGAAVDVSPAYHLDARAENVMAVAAWALGAAFLLLRARPRGGGRRGRRAPATASGRAAGTAWRCGRSTRYSDRLHDAEVRDLRNSIAAVLVPTGVLVALGFAFTPTRGSFTVGVGRDRGPADPRPARALRGGGVHGRPRPRAAAAGPRALGPGLRAGRASTRSRARRTSRSWRSWSRRSSRSSSSGCSRGCPRPRRAREPAHAAAGATCWPGSSRASRRSP